MHILRYLAALALVVPALSRGQPTDVAAARTTPVRLPACFALATIALSGAQIPDPAPQPARLTEPQDDYPEYSPDGRHIVFQSNRSGNWQLWLMNADGSGLRQLTTSRANDRQPSWSPDGARIVFSSDRGVQPGPERRRLYMLDVSPGFDDAESRLIRLGESPTQDIHPKWTRDGRAIVFNRLLPQSGGQTRAEIMILDVASRTSRTVALPPGMNTYASLTPDGRRLIHRGTTTETRDGTSAENSDIFSSAPDGSDRQRLTDDPAFDGWPAISPDGSTIAFASRRGGERFQIYLMPVAGGPARHITSGGYHHTQPAWSPDGRRLAVYRWTQDRAGEVGHLVQIEIGSAN